MENLNFAERSRIRNQEIGFIFQSFNLIGDLTVAENVELPLTYRSGMPAAERKRRVQESLERVGMAHRMRHYPSQLSGGQQQRVAVARALAGSPSILLADEPTGNLDSKNGEAVMELLQNLHKEGATICMVTHDPRFARHADRQIHLFDGKVVAEGEALEQFSKFNREAPAQNRNRRAGPSGSILRGATSFCLEIHALSAAAKRASMIQLKNIERSYKTGAGQTWVLRRINLEIREGEFLTIMGPSGAGKSSLLNVLALLDDQWLGEYWFKGEPCTP